MASMTPITVTVELDEADRARLDELNTNINRMFTLGAFPSIILGKSLTDAERKQFRKEWLAATLSPITSDVKKLELWSQGMPKDEADEPTIMEKR